MRLLSTDLSPYSARVRAQIYEKRLPVSIEIPEPPLRSSAFKAQYPFGQIPVLILDNGDTLSESWIILNYLEDAFPDTPLRPADALVRAKTGLLQAFADNHLRASILPLFQALFQKRELENSGPAFGEIAAQFAKLEWLLSSGPEPASRGLTIGDIALTPTVHFAVSLSKTFGGPDPMSGLSRSQAWWDWVRTHGSITKILGELTRAQSALTN
jgi:glutathione S-transferase